MATGDRLVSGQTVRALVVCGLAPIAALTACSGGSGQTPDAVPAAPAVVGSDPCATAYHQTMIGAYEGVVEYDASAESEAGGTFCRYALSVDVRARNIGTGQCNIEAQVFSTVEQLVVLPASDPAASECMDASGVLDIRDPLELIDAPVIDVDYTLPIRVDYLKRGPLEASRGPYFGDERAIGYHIRLFGGIAPTVSALAFDGETIAFEQANRSADRIVRGELHRAR